MQELSTEKQIYSVSTLNKSVKRLLESHFQVIWIEGEVSNLSRPSSGHLYFTLKDESAQVRCAMFRLRNISKPVAIENGSQILAYAKISLYDARGDYQLIIEHIEDRGEGLLRQQFEQLKKRLASEGLFDLQHKKPLPSFPQKIGVITSPTGAAIRDVLSVLKRRFASIPVILYPTQVQGEQAAPQICQAIRLANQRCECDVLIVCRGGGSLEDLWPFNEESVARTIFESDIPIVSGVGHEVDITIADYVADQRAATPSAAAELISPDKVDYFQTINYLKRRLLQLILAAHKELRNRLEHLAKNFIRPERFFLAYNQTLDHLETALTRGIKNKLEHTATQLRISSLKLQHRNPVALLKAQKSTLENYYRTLTLLINQKLQQEKQQLSNALRMLNSINPLQTLERGYSITTIENHVIESVDEIKNGDHIKVEIRDGFLQCIVNETIDKKST
jgi:exodeoxyribonuclease VII large subunit